MEKIYTIPVNEAIDACKEGGCPFCRLYATLEENELELILGASMMEPDIRIKTNEQGFCQRHSRQMFRAGNRLGLALILQSHIEELERDFRDPPLLPRGKKGEDRMEKLAGSCYLCGRTQRQFGRMCATAAYLWGEDASFRKRWNAIPELCLPHARTLLQNGRGELGKKSYAAFREATVGKVRGELAVAKERIDRFCRSFDYRSGDEPLGDAKAAVEDALCLLTGEEGIRGGKKE